MSRNIRRSHQHVMPIRKSANVYILQRPLEKHGQTLSDVFGDSGKHWGLIVEFKDNSGAYLCEIYSSMDSKEGMFCVSRSASGKPGKHFTPFKCPEACKENNPEATVTLYGVCETYVEELEKIVEDEAKKEEYHLITRNCQKFVLRLIELLKVEKTQENIKLKTAQDLSVSIAKGFGWGVLGIAAIAGIAAAFGGAPTPAGAVSNNANPRDNNDDDD